uniref:AviX7 n=1 Tax=Streptomyces viridochromogenes Tue57 TaxID=1160705 RepID=Q93KX8_STRVR|nr:AviX7 [Streptomyces viridochromogenes Tue57]
MSSKPGQVSPSHHRPQTRIRRSRACLAASTTSMNGFHRPQLLPMYCSS